MGDTTNKLTADMSWGNGFAGHHRWQAMMLESRQASTSRSAEHEDLSDLPVFSVPEEFAVKKDRREDEDPLSESKQSTAAPSKPKEKAPLSFHAAEFVPGDTQGVPQWFGGGNGFAFSPAAPVFEPSGDGGASIGDIWDGHMRNQHLDSELYSMYPGRDGDMGDDYNHSMGSAAYEQW